AGQQPRVDSALLAMEPSRRRGVGRRESNGAGAALRRVRVRVSAGPPDDVLDQSLRSVRAATGVAVSARSRVRAVELRDAVALSPDAAPTLRGMALCVLV